jgi:ATP-binding cassette subfamily F protein 3
MERFVARFRAKATKAKQAQSRIKMLEKMERIPPPPPESAAIRFRFPDPPASGRAAVELSAFSKAYPAPEGGRTAVFDHAGPLTLERGDKVALVGKNGAGKSTLARMLLGTEPFEGTREQDSRVEMAHFAQHQAEALNPSQTVFQALQDVSRGHSDTQLRSLLGAFLFSGDDAAKSVSVLSGGERSRLALARTLLSPANVLVLDEPTNHLDMVSKNVLAEALRQYTGTFVLVSHDRYFIDAVAESVWYVQDGTVRTYRGTYTEAQWQREHGTASRALSASSPSKGAAKPSPSPLPTSAPDAPPAGRSGGKKTKEEKRREAEARNALYRATKGDAAPVVPAALDPRMARRALDKVEKQIAAKEAERTALETAMADPDLYNRPAEFSKTLAQFEAVQKEVAALYETWETLAAQAEAG